MEDFIGASACNEDFTSDARLLVIERRRAYEEGRRVEANRTMG